MDVTIASTAWAAGASSAWSICADWVRQPAVNSYRCPDGTDDRAPEPAVDASCCSALNQSSSGEPTGHPRDSHRVYATPAIWVRSGLLVTVSLCCNPEACLFDKAVVDAIERHLLNKYVCQASGLELAFARLVGR
jgi:hypothetical protein